MRPILRFVLVLAAAAPLPAAAVAQPSKKDEEAFTREKPAIGDRLPDLTVYSPDGKEVKTSSLRGQHVVITFGCLT
jgi:cytochrome oxidase Cu insertion factor (SCO1/SenC/PrrC family)